MKVFDLFSGIGGFSLGLGRAGMQTIGFCEINEYCHRVLQKHWPDVPIFEDIRTITGEELEKVDLICGGFPCQPWSLAGKKQGTRDDRDLWPEMSRVIDLYKPRWVLGENVPGLDDKTYMGLDRTLSDLESLDYETVTFEIPACAVDAPHQRKRLWIVSHATGTERNGKRPLQIRQPNGPANGGEALADADSARCREQWRTCPTQEKYETIKRCSKWLPEPDVGRVAHGVPNRVDRLRALGNAVVPQIVEQIGKAILLADSPSTVTENERGL